MEQAGEITRLLGRLNGDGGLADERVIDELIPIVYGELKLLARSNRYRWSGHPGPQTTSLVHEAYYKLARQEGASFVNGRQFFFIASQAMRSILIDNARRRGRQKRGGEAVAVPLDEERLVSEERSEELLALDDALDRLGQTDSELARIVEMRTFGGLTVEEVSGALELSPATVKRKWRLARAWLFRELQGLAEPAEPPAT